MTCTTRPLAFGEIDFEAPNSMDDFSVNPDDVQSLTREQNFVILDGVLPALGITLEDLELYISRRRGYCDPLPDGWMEADIARGVIFD